MSGRVRPDVERKRPQLAEPLAKLERGELREIALELDDLQARPLERTEPITQVPEHRGARHDDQFAIALFPRDELDRISDVARKVHIELLEVTLAAVIERVMPRWIDQVTLLDQVLVAPSRLVGVVIGIDPRSSGVGDDDAAAFHAREECNSPAVLDDQVTVSQSLRRGMVVRGLEIVGGPALQLGHERRVVDAARARAKAGRARSMTSNGANHVPPNRQDITWSATA